MGTSKVPTYRRRPDSQFQGLVEHSLVGMAITQHGRLIYVNPKYCEIFGYSREELLKGMSPLDLAVDADRAVLAAHMEKRQTGAEPGTQYVIQGKRKDGSIIDVEVHGALMEIDGRPALVASVMDVSDRRRTEERLRLSEARFRLLFEEAPDAIVVHDLGQGRFTDANRKAEELFECDRAELLKRGPQHFYLPEQLDGRPIQESFPEHGRRALLGEEILFERRIRTAKGKDRTCEVRLVGLPSSSGMLIRASWTDVTERRRAEEKIREDEAQIRALVEQGVAAIFVIQDDMTIGYENRHFLELLGYSSEEVIGRPLLEFVAEANRQAVASAVQELFSGKASSVQLVAAVKRKDGSLVGLLAHGAMAEFRGRPAIFGVAIDITERRHAEEALRASSAYARSLIEASLDPLVTISREGKVTDVNEATIEATGVPRATLIGTDFAGYFTDPEKARAGYRKVFEKGFVTDYPLAIRHVSGRLREMLYNASLYRDADGEVAGVFAAARDITERKRAEQAVRASAIYARSLIEASLDPLVTINAEGKITDVNEATVQATGVARAALIGTDFAAYFTDPERARAGCREVFEKGSVTDYALALLHVSGRVTDVLYNASVYRDAEDKVAGVFAAARDISERKRAERTLQMTMRTLRALTQANEALVHATSEESLFQEMCRVIVEVGGYRMAWIGLAQDDVGKTVRPVARAGHDAGYIELAKISWADSERGQGTSGTAIRTGMVQVNRDFASNPGAAPWHVEALKRGYASNIALPLRNAERVFGTLTIYASQVDAFTPDEVELLSEMAGDISYGVIALRMRADRMAGLLRLERAMEETVQAIASTVEMRDAYTAGHQKRVAMIAEAIAKQLGLPANRIRGLRVASIVHDLGKIHIPAEILSKPGKLTPLEYEFIKSHSRAGYEILKPIEFPWPVADIVLQHHERLDGSGYPDGLKGDAILFEARIMAVADVVESMISHRPYRPALGLDLALAEIEKGRGRLYDAAAVDACVKLFRSGGISLD